MDILQLADSGQALSAAQKEAAALSAAQAAYYKSSAEKSDRALVMVTEEAANLKKEISGIESRLEVSEKERERLEYDVGIQEMDSLVSELAQSKKENSNWQGENEGLRFEVDALSRLKDDLVKGHVVREEA